MTQLMLHCTAKAEEHCVSIRGGVIDNAPVTDGDVGPCTYCDSVNSCPRDKRRPTKDRPKKKMDFKQLCMNLDEEAGVDEP